MGKADLVVPTQFSPTHASSTMQSRTGVLAEPTESNAAGAREQSGWALRPGHALSQFVARE